MASTTITADPSSDSTGGVCGNIDRLDASGIHGWLIDLSQPRRRLPLELAINGHPVATIYNDKRRDDVCLRIGHQVDSGFSIDWSDKRLFDAVVGADSHRLADADRFVFAVMSATHERQLAGPPLELAASDVRRWVSEARSAVDVRARAAADQAHITPQKVIEYFDSFSPTSPPPASDVKLIAYYLPQFHPIPENDEWWGKGFTEWTNAAQGRPYFEGHYQPHLPGELGFYDLRLQKTREDQARLAAQYGIDGFCYYYYWFSGRRLLEYPLQSMFESGTPDFPFCICWANENWSRRWDGSENEILVEQLHNEETDIGFISDVIPLFRDPRYICVDGAPLLIIYRVSLLPNPMQTAARWREACRAAGIPRIHLCLAETFALSEPNQYGFDSAVQFPPHGVVAPLENERIASLDPEFEGNIHDIRHVISDQISRRAPPYKRFPGVMTSWDNTARKKKAGNVFINGSPQAYELWLRSAIDQARERLPPGERLVFINAWNEWAEGAHLEPDLRNGRAYLEATLRARLGAQRWQEVIAYADAAESLSGPVKQWVVSSLRTQLEKQEEINRHLQQQYGSEQALPYRLKAQPGAPLWMADLPTIEAGHACIDQVNAQCFPVPSLVASSTRQKLLISGWSFCPPLTMHRETISYLIFSPVAADGAPYFTIVPERVNRTDVRDHFSDIPAEITLFSGFRYYIDVSDIVAGSYRLWMAHRGSGTTHLVNLNQEIEFD